MNARDGGPGHQLTSARPGGSLTTENFGWLAQAGAVGEIKGKRGDPGEHETHEVEQAWGLLT